MTDGIEGYSLPVRLRKRTALPGGIYRARAYGRHHYGIVQEGEIKKIRLWCTAKDDHTGAVSNPAGKYRMEFYPDQIARGNYRDVIALCDNVDTGQPA